jgi:type I restriction enzyme M protein
MINTQDLQKSLSDVSNYIYVNDGVQKDRVFLDVTKLMSLKILAEEKSANFFLKPFLDSLDPLEIDGWAQSMLEFGAKQGLLEEADRFWHLRNETLYWTAKELCKFNFSDFPADIKGEAFQALVVNNLRGDRGEYFTPPPLVAAICKLANLNPNSMVIDPACGSGGFLYGAFRAGVSPANLFGLELSSEVALAAKLRIKILGGSETQIAMGDSFNAGPSWNSKFDAVLMNPPFGAKSKIEKLEVLKRFELPQYLSKNGKPKPLAPEVLFLELAIQLAKPGGVIATVVPDGILQNSSYIKLREWILSKASLEGVISCPAVTFQPYGTGVKTSLLVLRKAPFAKSSQVYFGVSKSVGYDSRGKSFTVSEDVITNNYLNPKLEDLSSLVSQFIGEKNDQSNIGHGSFVKGSELVQRWDAEYYSQQMGDLQQSLNERGYVKLDSLLTIGAKRIDRGKLNDLVSYVAIADVDARTSQIVNIQKLAKTELPSRASYAVEPGQVIVATSGANTGSRNQANAIIDQSHGDMVVSNGFSVLSSDLLDSHCILGLVRSDLFLSQLMRVRTGHTIPSVSETELRSILVPSANDPIWQDWKMAMSELNSQASKLVNFAESTRG